MRIGKAKGKCGRGRRVMRGHGRLRLMFYARKEDPTCDRDALLPRSLQVSKPGTRNMCNTDVKEGQGREDELLCRYRVIGANA